MSKVIVTNIVTASAQFECLKLTSGLAVMVHTSVPYMQDKMISTCEFTCNRAILACNLLIY